MAVAVTQGPNFRPGDTANGFADADVEHTECGYWCGP